MADPGAMGDENPTMPAELSSAMAVEAADVEQEAHPGATGQMR